jgi:radical SAM protein with 4Fe4S-binding SPASM domain
MTQITPSQAMAQKSLKLLVPVGAAIELTQRCNLACFHCYNFDRTQAPKIPPNELQPEEILTVIRGLADLGILYLAFTGGEATLDHHLGHYVQLARSLHLWVVLKTNGVAKPGVFRELARQGVNAIDVSLYGASPETHDAISRRPGSFQRTIEGMEEIASTQCQLRINFLVGAHATHEVPSILDLGEKFGGSFAIGFQFGKRYDGTTDSTSLTPDKEKLKGLYQADLGRFLGDAEHTYSAACGCAVSNCAVASNGDVYPCIGAPIVSGNIRQQTIQDIWHHSPVFQSIRNLKATDYKTCYSCEDRAYCTRTSGDAFVNGGDFTGPDPMICEQSALLREMMEAKGLRVLA